MMLCSLVAMSKKGVVLESNGKATMYSDLTTAVNAAVDGDVIYLVRNTSYDCPKGLLIQRLIQLRGDGTPTIQGNVTISIDGMPEMKEPVMEGIFVNGKVTVTQSINNFKLRHCTEFLCLCMLVKSTQRYNVAQAKSSVFTKKFLRGW